MLKKWPHKLKLLKPLPKRNLLRLLRIKKKLMRLKWPLKLLKELELKN